MNGPGFVHKAGLKFKAEANVFHEKSKNIVYMNICPLFSISFSSEMDIAPINIINLFVNLCLSIALLLPSVIIEKME